VPTAHDFLRALLEVTENARKPARNILAQGRMLNYVWLGLIVCAVVFGSLNHHIDAVAQEGIKGAKEAVEIVLKLIGVMALWLGMMRLAEKAGLVQVLARSIRPLMRRLFPDVPPDHPAMGAMMMNMAANMLGIGNAATPLGLRAMRDLQRLNPFKETASNAMCTFLAINTSSIQLIPANQIAMLAAAGAIRPTAIIGTALVATSVSVTVALISVKFLEKLRWFRLPAFPSVAGAPPAVDATAAEIQPLAAAETEGAIPQVEPPPLGTMAKGLLIAFGLFGLWLFYSMTFPADRLRPGEMRAILCERGVRGNVLEGTIISETTSNILLQLKNGNTNTIAKQHPKYCPKAGDIKGQLEFELGLVGGATDFKIVPHADEIQRHELTAVRAINTISILALPFLIAFFPLYSSLRRVKVYEEFVIGAKEGFNVAVTIIPHVVGMLTAVFMFRAAGCIDALVHFLRPVLDTVHFPSELLPMALMRPISGGGTTALFIELIKTFGPDHLITRTAGTIIGSTETTLYVVAVYFGSVAVRRVRHAVAAGLIADVTGVIASVIVCRVVFG
jgi:spore maturation protein SpmA